jgi:solute carrier family 25 (mitochondrial aspartate/glutamate transporter), member 12/13
MNFSNDFKESNDQVIIQIRNNWFPKEDDLPTFRHFLAASTASALASGLFNPLDSLRVRWQIAPKEIHSSILVFSRKIIKQEGLWYGLWKPGVGINMVGMSLTSGLRFGSYETIRNHLHQMQQQDNESQSTTFTRTSAMIVAGLLSGSAAYYVTTPFHLLKTRLQATGNAGRSNLQLEFMTLIESGKFSSLYKGSVPLTIRGSLFTAGQMVGK